MGLVVEGLDVAYGRTKVLFDVALEVPADGLVCVMGRNGVGKTTLLNTVMGILRPVSGRVVLDGADIGGLRPDQRVHAGIAYVPQGRACFPQLTVLENLRVVAEACSSPPAVIDEALGFFPRLEPLLGRRAGFLSGGQQQQLAMARAIVTRPRLLLLDEPTEGIQPSIILEIEDAIAKLNATSGLAILLVEQYMEFALRLATRYVVLDAGRVAASGETSGFDPDSVRHLLAV
ncbi:MAG TPA: urea ABC transporter ATP-binding subunit UrtE [Actinomycetota bacterium]|jgi:urea transport system ATP-binding protein